MIIQWKDIDGYPGYQVSNDGQVRSIDMPLVNIRGRLRQWKGRILRPSTRRKGNGYNSVSLGNASKSTKMVHRLVAIAFIENPFKKPCVNHIDGNKKNNHVDNLEWATYSENEKHSYAVLGKKANCPFTGKKGKDSSSANPVDYYIDNVLVKSFDTVNECAAFFGGHPSNMATHIRKGIPYKGLDVRYKNGHRILKKQNSFPFL